MPLAPRLEVLEERLTLTTYNVTPTGAGLNSLARAVSQANADTTPDTIVLSPGQYNLAGQLTVTTPNNLTLEGTASSPGETVIDAQSQGRAFFISGSGSVTFQDLTIQHGLATDGVGTANAAEGGGILADGGGNVTLSNVVLQSNTAQAVGAASAQGGGIYVQGGSLDIQNSVIQNSDAKGAGARGGGVYFDSGSNPNAALTITYSTVSRNLAQGGTSYATDGPGLGGGLYTITGQVTIFASTLSGNTAQGGPLYPGPSSGYGEGGGAYLGGADTITNSTVANNTATAVQGYFGSSSSGGGLDFASTDTATLVNDTVAGNHSSGANDILNEGGTVALTNTIVADQYIGSVQSGGHNLIGEVYGSSGFSDAKGDLLNGIVNLGPLQDNGGPTQTMALLPGSPAIGAGDTSAVSVTGPFDQRGPGYNRLFNGTIDIGAYQVQSYTPPSPPPSPPPPPPLPSPPPPTPPTPPAPPGGGGVGGNGSSSVAPVGSLMLFGFGFSPNGQLDLLELDQKRQVFSLAFGLANLERPSAASAQFVNTDIVLQNLTVTNAGGFPALLGSLVGSSHQSVLLMTVPIQLIPGAAFADLLTAWQATTGI